MEFQLALNREVERRIIEINNLTTHLTPANKRQIYQYMQEAVDLIQKEVIRQYGETDPQLKFNPTQESEARNEASKALSDARAQIRRESPYETSPFDPASILNNYAKGYYALLMGCPLNVDVDKETWEVSNMGATGCPVLAQLDSRFTDVVEGGNFSVDSGKTVLNPLFQLQARGEAGFYFDPYRSLAHRLSVGLKSYLGPKQQFLAQTGGSLNLLWGSLDDSEGSFVVSLAPYYYLGGGLSFPKRSFEVVVNTDWGILKNTEVTYTEGMPQPTDITQHDQLDFNLDLLLVYKGFSVSGGYQSINQTFHTGVGFEKTFDLPVWRQ